MHILLLSIPEIFLEYSSHKHPHIYSFWSQNERRKAFVYFSIKNATPYHMTPFIAVLLFMAPDTVFLKCLSFLCDCELQRSRKLVSVLLFCTTKSRIAIETYWSFNELINYKQRTKRLTSSMSQSCES